MVSWVAIQSREGTDSRGNLAAWASGSEKSRQRRQEDAEVIFWGFGFGFVDWIFEISGREVRGTGGGASVFGGVGLDALLSAPLVSSWGWGLFIPKERADLAGIGRGGSGDTCVVAVPDTGRVGLLGGSAGVVGGRFPSTVATLDVDLVPTKGILALSTSCHPGNAFDFSISLYLFSTSSFVRLGGSGGRDEGSKMGALTRLPSIEGVLESTVLAVPFDRAEMEDIFEKVDEIDSLEAFLLIGRFSDGLLGGSAGEGCVDAFLAGNLGGGADAGFAGCATT